MFYLKNNSIPDEFTAPGLDEVKKRLLYDKLSEQEKIDYNHHLKQKQFEQNSISTADRKGEARGLKKGLEKGKAERAKLKAEKEAAQAEKEAAQAELKTSMENVVINSYKAGLPIETIVSVTGLTNDEIITILKRENLL